MVTTRHASYSPEKLDSPATDNASARKAKRGADDVSKASPSTKRRKIEAQKPKPANAAAQPKQSIRIRFGSEEADAVPPAIVPEAEPADLDAEDDEEEAEDEDDSDDEAPEDISAIAAQKNAEATAAAAALAVEKQRAEDKRKRQERTTRLAEQAQERKRLAPTRPAKALATKDDAVEDDEEEPDLLPAELLATEFVRPPTPPPAETVLAPLPAKNRVVKLADEAPRDRKVGPVTVSVLQKTNKLLPPKASAASRDLREKWLAGKRSVGKGEYAVQRKAFGGGFVKR